MSERQGPAKHEREGEKEKEKRIQVDDGGGDWFDLAD